MRQSLQIVLEEIKKSLADDGLDPSMADQLTVDTMIAIRNRVADEWRGQGLSHEIIRLEAFRRSLDRIDYTNDLLAFRLNALYMRHRYGDITVYPDVRPALDQLGERYVLGIISNGNSYPERCGLGGYFAFVLASQDHGIEKPDPRLFQLALQQIDCLPEEMVHVGDSLTTDVTGANATGVHSVWLNREGLLNRSLVRPDFEICSLTELTDVLTQLWLVER